MKAMLLSFSLLALTACANTWEGAKVDAAQNAEKTEELLKEGGQSLGRGLVTTGEKLQEISQ